MTLVPSVPERRANVILRKGRIRILSTAEQEADTAFLSIVFASEDGESVYHPFQQEKLASHAVASNRRLRCTKSITKLSTQCENEPYGGIIASQRCIKATTRFLHRFSQRYARNVSRVGKRRRRWREKEIGWFLCVGNELGFWYTVRKNVAPCKETLICRMLHDLFLEASKGADPFAVERGHVDSEDAHETVRLFRP